MPALADVKDPVKIRRLFERHRPTVVFHAAAYKHVPMMEANPLESVRNNVLGTKVLAEIAAEHGVKQFVLVSTDKAVRPKNVLGQTKAICEWVVQSAAARDGNDRASSPFASATCSAPPAASSRSSAARSLAAGR